ncbi:aspartate/glutamate racemase family protein [Microbacterium sediminicola]|uniref:Aspartate/glutamate racemase family protein n=1 Tax=Microbacterium sediminicola TaxID=415210 RepID=A0ABN2HRG5_9MICO
MQKLGIIHTVSRLAPVFDGLVGEYLPGVGTVVIADELLLQRTIRDGAVDGITRERLAQHVEQLASYGVDAVLVTCSSVGAAVDELAATSEVPVLRVDRAMAERAVGMGRTIGVLATLPTTLVPTVDLVRSAADGQARDVTILPRLCEGAFDALGRGDVELHDAIIADELDQLVAQVDVVVLAQASMARVAEGRETGGVPVLSSPRLAIEQIAQSIATPL